MLKVYPNGSGLIAKIWIRALLHQNITNKYEPFLLHIVAIVAKMVKLTTPIVDGADQALQIQPVSKLLSFEQKIFCEKTDMAFGRQHD